MDNSDGMRWYAIQVRTRWELSVAKILGGKGFEPLVPQYKSRRNWSDRKVELDLPLFPGYVFCQFDGAIRLPIVTTAGVIRIVGTSRGPTPIEASEIEALQQIVQHKCKTEPHPFVAIGTRVRVLSGPLFGAEGIVKGYKNRQLILSIGLIQRSVSVDLNDDPTTIVQPLSTPQQFMSTANHTATALMS